MTLGEIKIEALRLMRINEERDIAPEDLEELTYDATYAPYLVNMWAVINRCFCDLENKGVLPRGSVTLFPELGEVCAFGKKYAFTLSHMVADYLAISHLVCEHSTGEYVTDAPYRIEEDRLILPIFNSETTEYRLYYHRRIERIKPSSAYDVKIDIPDHIAEYIPYFVKGELFAGNDDPSEAAEAHNMYEAGVAAAIRSSSRIAKVETKYSI